MDSGWIKKLLFRDPGVRNLDIYGSLLHPQTKQNPLHNHNHLLVNDDNTGLLIHSLHRTGLVLCQNQCRVPTYTYFTAEQNFLTQDLGVGICWLVN